MLADYLGLYWRKRGLSSAAGAAQRFRASASLLGGTPVHLRIDDGCFWSALACFGKGLAPPHDRPDLVSGTSPRAHLLSSGAIGRDATATAESLIASWRNEGPNGLVRLTGKFSLLLFDPERESVLAMRDRVGHEPLYYLDADDFLAFSTSFKALRSLRAGAEGIDELGVADYLVLSHFDRARTLLHDIRRLPPAHWLSATPGQPIEVTQYWSLKDCRPRSFASPEACYSAFRAVVIEAVEDDAADSTQAGLLLSGGLDSSALGAALCHSGGAGRTLHAVGSVPRSDGSGAPVEDEVPFMQAFVQHYPQTALHLEDAGDGWTLGGLAQSVAEVGFPHRDGYFYKFRAMVLRARELGCDTVFSGFGGDFFASAKLHEFFAQLFFSGEWKAMTGQLRAEGGLKEFGGLFRFLVNQLVRPLLAKTYHAHQPNFGRSRMAPYPLDRIPLSAQFLRETDFVARARRAIASLYVDVTGDSLIADTESLESGLVAHSLEYLAALSRAQGVYISSPLLDERVVEFAATAPLVYRRRGVGTRSLLRHAFTALLPDEIALRTSKGLFCPDSSERTHQQRVRRFLQDFEPPVPESLAHIVDIPRFRSDALRALAKDVDEDELFCWLLPTYLLAGIAAFASGPGTG